MPKKTKLISIKCIACTEYKDCTLYDKWGCPAVEYARSVLDGKDRDGKEIITCRWVKLACERFVDDLKRGEKRGLYFNPSEKPGGAAFAIDFFSHLKLWKGREYRGNEFVLAPHYQFVISNLMGWKKLEDRTRRFGTGYVEMARKGAKALALDTPVPTPDGWTTIGDIDGGDILFDENGKQCRVICTTSTLYNEECYEVVFSDGTKIIADAGHLWETVAKKWGRKVRTTEEIRKTIEVSPNNSRIEWRHKVSVTSGLLLPEKQLPIDPYVLGCWLGDGHSRGSRITFHPKDAQIIREILKSGIRVSGWRKNKGSSAYTVSIGNHDKKTSKLCRRGHEWKKWRTKDNHCLLCNRIVDHARRNREPIPPYTILSFWSQLRDMGLSGNKHIPKEYLRSSYKQRLSLLQGLMDTDGTVDERGHCSFTNIKLALIENFEELAGSLGFKFFRREFIPKCNGKECGIAYRVSFYPYIDTPVFRLARKLNRQKQIPKRTTRAGFRQIVAVNKIKSVPVKCVSVSSDSKLFLVSKSFIPTHNSTVAGGLGAYFFVADKEYGAEIYTAAVKEKQAKIVWENIYNLLKDSMFSEGVDFYKQNMSIESTLSKCEFVVGDPKGLDGLDTHFCSLDELHAHPTPEIHDLIVDSTGTRPQPMILIITTAGFDQTGVCYQRREYLTQILKKTIIDDSFFGIIYTLDTKKDWPGLASITSKSKTKTKEDDWRDEDVWVKAMPGLWGITKNDQRCGVDDNGDQIPGYMTRLGKVRDIALYAASNPAALNNFLTKRMNIWTQQINRFIDLQLWDSNYTSDVYIME